MFGPEPETAGGFHIRSFPRTGRPHLPIASRYQ